jgi:hypothetical protein
MYLIYAGVVLAVGSMCGAFRGHSVRPSNDKLTPIPSSFLVLSNANAQASVPLPQGLLAFDAERIQATVHEGDEQAHFVFNFTNISSKEVIIDAVTTSCGCTTAELPQMPWIVPSRAKGQIPVTMNVLGHTGKVSKTVTVVAAQGSKTLNVEANILPVANSNNTNNASAH